MSRAWANGSTRAWRHLRARILAANQQANNGRCQLHVDTWCPRHGRACPAVCTGQATQVHHAKGKQYGDDPAQLMAVCAACNRHVGAPRSDPTPTPRSNW